MDENTLDILIADDDPSILRLVATILESKGHTVRLASGAQEALDLLEESCPDIIISDWDMPDVSGIELARAIRNMSLPKYVYFLMTTANSTHDDVVWAFNAGADDFIGKPIRRGELLARIRAGQRVITMERQLRWLSNSDALTGTFNRRHFHKVLTDEWGRATRYNRPLSSVMVDIDYFKKINDTYGHAMGDEVLRNVANTLQEECRNTDFLCRYGGEEFCVLLTETDENGAWIWADRVRRALNKKTIQIDDQAIDITASLGVAQRWSDTPSADAMINMADQALLVAKNAGRDRVLTYTSIAEDGSRDPAPNCPLDHVNARDVMSAIVYSTRQDTPLREVAEQLVEMRIGASPVVDDAGRLVGIVSQRDLLMLSIAEDDWKQPVSSIMKTNTVCYEEITPALEIFEFLSRVSIHQVMVVKEGKPTGIIRRDGFLRWFLNWSAQQTDSYNDAEAQIAKIDQRVATLLATAHELTHASENVVGFLEGQPDQFVPFVIGEASRMQDLANDLLASCRSAKSLDV